MQKIGFPKDAISFFVGVSKLAARARAQGNFDAAGDPIWDIPAWKAFCHGVREYSHIQAMGIGMAAYRTCIEVESMLEDGFSAADIHNVLKGFGIQRAIEENQKANRWYEEPAA